MVYLRTILCTETNMPTKLENSLKLHFIMWKRSLEVLLNTRKQIYHDTKGASDKTLFTYKHRLLKGMVSGTTLAGRYASC